MTARAARLGLAPLLVLLALLAGCVSLPEEGPVVEADASAGAGSSSGIFINPPPPRPGAPPAEIVQGFLEAMTATPVQANVARQYLAADAQAAWDPEQETITYAEASPPRGLAAVTVRLSGADRLDEVGAWQGALPADRSVLRFSMKVEEGEWRIRSAPNALIVPEGWFAQRYRQVSLYFFDPTAQVLVPEPVFVPRGEQLATTLVRGLLRGPGRGLGRVSLSFLPPGLEPGLSVPVDDGVAQLALSGNAGQPPLETVDLMLAQLAWTLRQEPGIRALRVSLNGEPLRGTDGRDEYTVDEGAAYDPAGARASSLLFGLREGLLVSGTPQTLAPVGGPLGQRPFGVRSVAVDLGADRLAAVSDDGRALLAGPVDEDGAVRTLVSGAQDLARPAWDFSGRIWLVDRRADGALVSHVARGQVRTLEVPGVSGRRVTSFLVSRDGSRLVAVVRRRAQDLLLVSRIERDGRGRVVGATPAQRISWAGGGVLRARDLAWSTPTNLSVLQRLVRDQLLVRPVSVDGAPVAQEGVSVSLLTGVRALLGSPKSADPGYALTRDGLRELATANGVEVPLDPPVDSLHYVG